MRNEFVVRLLQGWLNTYLEQILPEQVEWSLWKGSLQLHHALLRPRTLLSSESDGLAAHLILTEGRIGQVSLTLPWFHRWQTSFELLLADVALDLRYGFATACPETASEPPMGAGHAAASGLLSSTEGNRSNEQERQQEEHAFQRCQTGDARSPQKRPRREGRLCRSSPSHAAASIWLYLLEKLGLFACSFRAQVSRLSASISIPRIGAGAASELSTSASRWNTFRVQWENLTLSSPMDEAEVLTFLQSMPDHERIPSREELTEWFRTDGTVCKCLSWEALELTCNDVSLISPVHMTLMIIFNIYTTNPVWVCFRMTPLCIDIAPWLTELASLWLPLVGHGVPEQPRNEGGYEHVTNDPVDADSDILVPFWKALFRGRIRLSCYGVLERLQISVECLENLPGVANLDLPLQSVLQLRPLHLSIQYGWNLPVLAQMQCSALELTLGAAKETNGSSLSVNGHASASSEAVTLVRLTMDRTEKQSSALDVRWALTESMAEENASEHTSALRSCWPWSRTNVKKTRSPDSKRYTTDLQICRTLYCCAGMLNIRLKDCLTSPLSIRQDSSSASERVTCSVARPAAETPREGSAAQSEASADSTTAPTKTTPFTSSSFLLHVERIQLALEDTSPKMLLAALDNLCLHVDHRPLNFASDWSCYAAGLGQRPIMTRSWQVYRVHTEEEQQEAELSKSDRPIERAVWLSGLHIQQAHGAWVPSTVSEPLDAIRDDRTERLIQLMDPLVLTGWRQASVNEPWSAWRSVAQTTDRPVLVASSISLRVYVPALAAFWAERFSSYQKDSLVQVSQGKDDGIVQQRNETALDWPLKLTECTSFQIVIDWDGLGTDTTSELILHGRRIQLRLQPVSIPETIPSIMQLEADALTVTIAGQEPPLLQCLGLAAQVPSSVETWTRTPSAPMDETRVTEPIRVQLMHLESVLATTAITCQLQRIHQVWLSLYPSMVEMNAVAGLRDTEKAASGSSLLKGGPPSADIAWLLSLDALDFIHSSSAEQQSALYIETVQVVDMTLGPLLHLGARRSAEQDLSTTLCRFGHPTEAITTAMSCCWQRDKKYPTELEHISLQLANIRLSIDEEKTRHLWSTWQLVRPLCTFPWVQTKPSSLQSASSWSIASTGAIPQTESDRLEHSKRMNDTDASSQQPSTSDVATRVQLTQDKVATPETIQVKLRIVCAQLQCSAQRSNEQLVIHLDEIETENLLQTSLRLYMNQTQAWHLSECGLNAQALTNQVDWVLVWRANPPEIQLDVPTIHALGTVRDLSLILEVLDWIHRLQDEIYQGLLPSNSASLNRPAVYASSTTETGTFADMMDMGEPTNPSLPRGCTHVRCERLFFTLWPRTDDRTGLDQQHAALKTLWNDPESSAGDDPRSSTLGSKTPTQGALADLAATTLAIDYNYHGLDESLHFRAEMVRLRTEWSRYLGPQGELVVVPLLHVRYQVLQKLPMPSTPQPEVRIQLDAARVLFDWTIVQRVWSEFSDPQATETPLERASPSESMAREDASSSEESVDDSNPIGWQLHIEAGPAPCLLVVPFGDNEQSAASNQVRDRAVNASTQTRMCPVVGLRFSGKAVFWDRPSWFKVAGYQQAYPRWLALSSLSATVSELAYYVDEQGRWYAGPSPVQDINEDDMTLFERAQSSTSQNVPQRLQQTHGAIREHPRRDCSVGNLAHSPAPEQQESFRMATPPERAALFLRSTKVRLHQCLVRESLRIHVEKHLRWDTLHLQIDGEFWTRFPFERASNAAKSPSADNEHEAAHHSSPPESAAETCSKTETDPRWYQIQGRMLSVTWRIVPWNGPESSPLPPLTRQHHLSLRCDDLKARLLNQVVPSITTLLHLQTRCRAYLASDLVLEPARIQLEYRKLRNVSDHIRSQRASDAVSTPQTNRPADASPNRVPLATDSAQRQSPEQRSQIRLSSLDPVRFNLTPQLVAAIAETSQVLTRDAAHSATTKTSDQTVVKRAPKDLDKQPQPFRFVNRSGVTLDLGQLGTLSSGQTRTLDNCWAAHQTVSVSVAGHESQPLPWSRWQRLMESMHNVRPDLDKTPTATQGAQGDPIATSILPGDDSRREIVTIQALQWPDLALLCVLCRRACSWSFEPRYRVRYEWSCSFESPLYWENQTPLSLSLWAHWDREAESRPATLIARIRAAANPSPDECEACFPRTSIGIEQVYAQHWCHCELFIDQVETRDDGMNCELQVASASSLSILGTNRASSSLEAVADPVESGPPSAASRIMDPRLDKRLRLSRPAPAKSIASSGSTSSGATESNVITSQRSSDTVAAAETMRDARHSSLWHWALRLAESTTTDSTETLWVHVHRTKMESIPVDQQEARWGVLVRVRILRMVPCTAGPPLPIILVTLQAPLQVRNALPEPIFLDKTAFVLPGWVYRCCRIDHLIRQSCAVATAELVSHRSRHPFVEMSTINESLPSRAHPMASTSSHQIDPSIKTIVSGPSTNAKAMEWRPGLWTPLQLPNAFRPPQTAFGICSNCKTESACFSKRSAVFLRPEPPSSNSPDRFQDTDSKSTIWAFIRNQQARLLDCIPSSRRRWSQGNQQTSADLVGVASRTWVQLFESAVSNSPERSRAQAVLCSRMRRQTAMVVASDCGALDHVACVKPDASFETDSAALMVADSDDNDDNDNDNDSAKQRRLDQVLEASRPVTWTPIGVQYRLEHPRSVRELVLCMPVLWCSLWSASSRTWIQYNPSPTLRSDWITRMRHRLAKRSNGREIRATYSPSAADAMPAQALDAPVLAEASQSRATSRQLVRTTRQAPSVCPMQPKRWSKQPWDKYNHHLCLETPPFVLSSCPWLEQTQQALSLAWRVEHSRWSRPCTWSRLEEHGLVLSLDLIQQRPAVDAAPFPESRTPADDKHLYPGQQVNLMPSVRNISTSIAHTEHELVSVSDKSFMASMPSERSTQASDVRNAAAPLLTDARWPWLYDPNTNLLAPGARLASCSTCLSSVETHRATAASQAQTRPRLALDDPDALSSTFERVTAPAETRRIIRRQTGSKRRNMPHRRTDIVVCLRPLRYPLEYSQLMVVYPRYRIVNLWPERTILVRPMDERKCMPLPDRWSWLRWMPPSSGMKASRASGSAMQASAASAEDALPLCDAFRLEPGAMATLHWPTDTQRPGLRLSVAAPGWSWSGLVPLLAGKSQCLRIWHALSGECCFPRVHTAAGTGDASQVHLVTILPPHPFLTPYLICNQTIECIRFAQRLERTRGRRTPRHPSEKPNAAGGMVQKVDPLSDCPYAWDEPQAEPILDLWMDGYGYMGGFRFDQEACSDRGKQTRFRSGWKRHLNTFATECITTNRGGSVDDSNGTERSWKQRSRRKRKLALVAVPRWLREHSLSAIFRDDDDAPIVLTPKGIIWQVPVSTESPRGIRARSFRLYIERKQATLCLVIAECENAAAAPAITVPRDPVMTASWSGRSRTGPRDARSTLRQRSTATGPIADTAAVVQRFGFASGFECTLYLPQVGISLLQTAAEEPFEIREVIYAAVQQFRLDSWHAKVVDHMDYVQQRFAVDQIHRGALSLQCGGIQVDHNATLRRAIPPSRFGVAFAVESLGASNAPDQVTPPMTPLDSPTNSFWGSNRGAQETAPCRVWSPCVDPELLFQSWRHPVRIDTRYAAPWSDTNAFSRLSSDCWVSPPGLQRYDHGFVTTDDSKETSDWRPACHLRVQFESSTAGAHTFLRLHSGELQCGRMHVNADALLAVELVDWIMTLQRQMAEPFGGTSSAARAPLRTDLNAEREPLSLIWTRLLNASGAAAVSLPGVAFERRTSRTSCMQHTASPSTPMDPLVRKSRCSSRIASTIDSPGDWGLFDESDRLLSATSCCNDSVTDQQVSSRQSVDFGQRSHWPPEAFCGKRAAPLVGDMSLSSSRTGEDASRALKQALESALLRGLPSVQQVQQRSEQSLRLLFHDFAWGPLALAVSVRTDPVNLGTLLRYRGSDWPRLMAIMLAPLMNVRDASLWLRALVLDGVFETTSDWKHHVVRHYQQQLSREVWKILSSAEWLGNPARYVRSLYQSSKHILRQMHARLRRHQVHSALATLLEMSLGYLAQLGFVSFDILYRISTSLQRTISGSLVSTAETDSAALEAAEIRGAADAIDAETIRIRNGLGDRSSIAGLKTGVTTPEQASCGRGHSSAVAWAPNAPPSADLWRRMRFILALPFLVPLQILSIGAVTARDMCGRMALFPWLLSSEEILQVREHPGAFAALRPPRIPTFGHVTVYDIEDSVLGAQLWQILIQAGQVAPATETYRFCCRYVSNGALLCTSKRLWCFVAQVEGSMTASRAIWSWNPQGQMKWDDIVLLWSTSPACNTLQVLAFAPEKIPPHSHFKKGSFSGRRPWSNAFPLSAPLRLLPAGWVSRVVSNLRALRLRSALTPHAGPFMPPPLLWNFAHQGWQMISIPLGNSLVTRAVAQRLRAEWYRALSSRLEAHSRAVVFDRWWWWWCSWRRHQRPAVPDIYSRIDCDDLTPARSNAIPPTEEDNATSPCLALAGYCYRTRAGWAEALYSCHASILFPYGIYQVRQEQ